MFEIEESFGLDFPDSSSYISPCTIQSQSTASEHSDRRSSIIRETIKSASDESDSGDHYSVGGYENVPPSRQGFDIDDSGNHYNVGGYENVPPKVADNKKIKLKSALKVPPGDVNPEVEENEYFKYYAKHLGDDKGWCPAAYTIEEVRLLSGFGLH